MEQKLDGIHLYGLILGSPKYIKCTMYICMKNAYYVFVK